MLNSVFYSKIVNCLRLKCKWFRFWQVLISIVRLLTNCRPDFVVTSFTVDWLTFIVLFSRKASAVEAAGQPDHQGLPSYGVQGPSQWSAQAHYFLVSNFFSVIENSYSSIRVSVTQSHWVWSIFGLSGIYLQTDRIICSPFDFSLYPLLI